MILRYFDGCPNWRTTLERIETVFADLNAERLEVSLERIESHDDAERLRFIGSPTLLLDGSDPFDEDAGRWLWALVPDLSDAGGPAGSPTEEQLREVLAAYLDGEATS